MNLFFETSGQAYAFLFTLPLGFLLAFCLDLFGKARKLRPLLDICTLLSCGLILVWLLLILQDERMRLYHILAVFLGAILYLCGVGQIAVRLKRALLTRKSRKKAKRQEENGTVM